LPFYPTEVLLLRRYRPVVEPDIVKQAGPETAGLKILAGANVQAAIRADQFRLCVFGNLDIINVQLSIGKESYPALSGFAW
jgi:hypothetical protein